MLIFQSVTIYFRPLLTIAAAESPNRRTGKLPSRHMLVDLRRCGAGHTANRGSHVSDTLRNRAFPAVLRHLGPAAVRVECRKSRLGRETTNKSRPQGRFSSGLDRDAEGFGRVFRGITEFLAVVFLPNPMDRGDGEESSVCTNQAITLSRFHCCLEQHQWQSETPFLIFTYPPGHVFQVLDYSDDRVKRCHIAGFQ